MRMRTANVMVAFFIGLVRVAMAQKPPTPKDAVRIALEKNPVRKAASATHDRQVHRMVLFSAETCVQSCCYCAA